MEIALGALPSLLAKLGELLAEEYKLQKEVKGGIKFLQSELECMKAALEDISKTPPHQVSSGDKIWARNVRELSYDIEDNIDTFMVQVRGHQTAKRQGFKKFVDKTLGSLMQPKIRRKIALDVRDIKSRVIEVHNQHSRYEIKHSINRPVKIDPRALVRYEKVTNLVGIDETRDEIIKMMEGNNELSKQHDKVVSIVGFGGLGKTTLANVVYEKIRAQFDCSAFVSVSQTPHMDTLFKNMFCQLAKKDPNSTDIIDQLREFLQGERYFVIIDDIWDISYWKMIRCALPDDTDEYRIITTTRDFKVAKEIGGAYKMRPLSLEDSRILMYGRIFGKEDKDKCPDEQLEEVSNKILKKCDGVPLAIITIASLLVGKGRNKLEWYDVCNSIGAGLEKDSTLDDMRKILSLSYYDMPSHLRACLLYFSMFPEDYDIRKDRLIWLWIAEGFIQSEKQEKSLYEMGESYLNELINRSMIQPKHNKYSGMVECCRVHDMVLDLIRSLSSEENFVTIQNDMSNSSASGKVRRLSLQKGKAGHGNPKATLSIEHVRSVIVFPPAIDQVPTLENFRVLRVLDLEGCNLSQGYSIKYLGNLLHLRYLGLRDTNIDQLPNEIGNLQFLQTLDVYGNKIPSLPLTILRLTQLMCLCISRGTRVPKGVGSLTALEELSCLSIDDDPRDILEELGHLTEIALKVLNISITSKINWDDDGFDNKSLVECIKKFHKIQCLEFDINFDASLNLDGWVIVPQHLRRLQLWHGLLFSKLPGWVNPSLLLDLSDLWIRVKVLQQEDLEIIGRLPALRYLKLMVDHEDLGIHRKFVVGAGLFPILVVCRLCGFGVPMVFQQGSMPRLVVLWCNFPLQRMREINGGFDLGVGNLASLKKVNVCFQSGDASTEEEEVKKEVAFALRRASQVHPNHPTFYVRYAPVVKTRKACKMAFALPD